MKGRVGYGDRRGANIERPRIWTPPQQLEGRVGLKGFIQIQVVDRFGREKSFANTPNLVVTEGLNRVMDTMLALATDDPTSVSVGIMDTTGTPAVAAGDTAAQIGGSNDWDEMVTTPYSETTREVYTPNGAAAAGAVSNSSSRAQWNFTGAATINGAFLVFNDNVIGGTTGILYSGGIFTAQAVANTDIVNIQYDFSAADV